MGVNQLNLIDVGSSFNLFEPFNYIEQAWTKDLHILCFEPNKETVVTDSVATRININKALWNQETEISFYVAKEKSKSSVHPPNIQLIDKFLEKDWLDRQTEKKIKLKATTLDSIIKENNFRADFLKIDSQGSEFEILEGSIDSLNKGIFGALLETWSYPFHKNQKLTYEVMELMNQHGYFLADLNKGGYYRRRILDSSSLFVGQIGQIDLLFFETFEKFTSIKRNSDEIIKAACLADLYGMADYGTQILDYYKKFDRVISKIVKKRKTLINTISNQWRIEKIRNILKLTPRTPPLH